ncbi:WhiB family transcriptional regulator [Brachybacterium sp. AOP25-B2-12]|uniref:WhiB family transcriptional regulator n=1 Tax=Brachybacterium sp. AOP25-B2-12 TaxID=3457710 RepID=UPI0040334CE2
MTDVMTRAVSTRPTTAMLPCQTEAADLFFSERPADLEAAKVLCADCPLRRECLEGAVARSEPWGVWGGAIFQAGEIIAVKRPRGRPRKNTEITATATSSSAPAPAAAPALHGRAA